MIEPRQNIETAAVISAYNEENTIASVIKAAACSRLVDAVVVVSDGSKDSTATASHEMAEELREQGSVPITIASHVENLGKTETMRSGVDLAKSLGGTSLNTLVFLDADSSPIWSRDTPDNMKLWQLGINRLLLNKEDTIDQDILLGRQNEVFVPTLSRYIDEIVGPVKSGKEVMRTGMYQRNFVIDTILTKMDKKSRGGHAGNRAVSINVWDGLMDKCSAEGIVLKHWDIEAALNEYVGGSPTGTFMMYGVVNVGSRVKSGGFLRGLARMAKIHGQAPFTKRKLRQP